MTKLALSYSHRDEALRVELEKHLAPLRRQGLIDTWHDRRIEVGQDFANEIDRNFEEAQVILLLVSPDFIASDYCYNIEMTRALERHNEESARVIPVILRPCHWQGLPFGRLQATPRDGKPVTEFPSLDAGFYDVVNAVTRALKAMGGHPPPAASIVRTRPVENRTRRETSPRSSNLRVRREFSDRDRDTAISECFEFLARFFDASLQELKSRNEGIDVDYQRVDANGFSATIYRGGKRLAACGIWMDQAGRRGGNLYYSQGGVTPGSYNESVSVEDDGYSLGFSPMGMRLGMRNRNERELLTQQGVGEYFWEMLMEPLQH